MADQASLMRKIISISVPEPMQLFIKRRIDNGEYDSVSEYFRELVRLDQNQERIKAQSAGMRRYYRENQRPNRCEDPESEV